MKKSIRYSFLLVAMLCSTQAIFAAEPTNYYNSALGKSDENLMNALKSIIHNHTEVSYTSGLLSAFKKADTDKDGYIIDIYSNCRYKPSDNGSSASHVGEGYNREHSFPRSWFGGEVAPMNTDVFHVYPTDIKVNSQRSNFPYGVCAKGTRLSYGNYVAKGKLGVCTYPGYSGTVFEPDDEYKGDLARTYFYMVTCYKDELPSWPGSDQLNYAGNRYKAFSTWTINMLMEWTRLDPVSDKEIKRNEAVYGIQGNRNPFIDHPELAEYIWGNMQGKCWNGTGEDIPATITSPVNGSIIDMGTVTVGNQKEYTINVKGEGLTTGLSLVMEDNEFFYVNQNTFTASEVNSGTSLTIGFATDDEGTYSNQITLSSEEVSTTFTVTINVTEEDTPPDPPVVQGDSIMEDWEGCTTGGYWTDQVMGNAFLWYFNDAGIWGDNLRHGELSCRLGKSSSSSITMLESVTDVTAIGFYAASFGNDSDAELSVAYSTTQGSSWIGLGTVTVTKGTLQHYVLDIDTDLPVRFGISQMSGSRVNIDDITIYRRTQVDLRGDVNGDGEVNIADVNALLNIILGGEADAATMVRADINEDGEINIADVNAVIDIILSN
ncbi:MAG: endonuclease [Muribaculaceae bacterium]|nr:endonuclease [Muribaculaceae bacterium]